MPRVGYGTLLRIDQKLETPFDEARDAGHHTLAGRFAAHVDIAVVCVTDKTVATTLKLAIQFIQHEIRKQRRERATLRGALATCLE